MKRALLLLLICIALPLTACGSGLTLVHSGPAPSVAAYADELDGALAALMEENFDLYAAYFDEDDYRMIFEDYYGEFGGIGIRMINENGGVVIYGLFADSPAERAGLLAGDIIISVDGVPVPGDDTEQAAKMIRGDEGSTVSLTVSRDGEQHSFTMTREIIEVTNITGENLPEYYGVAYIEIESFAENTFAEFADTFNRLYAERPIETLIIDLRTNGGGALPAAINIANLFVPAGSVIVTEKTAFGETASVGDNGQLNSLRLILLQNEYTASASEVLIGALKDSCGALLIGTTSFGKGIAQSIIPLSSGGGLRYTRSIYYTPSGFSLHEVGLEPDIVVETTEDISSDDYYSTDAERNPHLGAAIAYLQEQGLL
ncbi:MAG: S41 family peptidase [Bacillota bacterium]|nr:S41 family peptidase [Bacillota bacterium]